MLPQNDVFHPGKQQHNQTYRLIIYIFITSSLPAESALHGQPQQH